jgi:molybdate transport system substrate-binding protein
LHAEAKSRRAKAHQVTELHVLSAGAAKAVVTALAPALQTETGATTRADFGAVGAIRDKLCSGARCDVLVLTAAMLEALAHTGHVVPDGIAPLGRVRTGIAVRTGEPFPAIGDRDSLRQSMLAATGLFVPDVERSTAGAHFAKVLRELGIHDAVGARLHEYESGAVAMHELAQSRGLGLLGCTQVTEINYTPGVVLIGPLPAEFELATVYSAAVSATAQQPGIARRFVQMLTDDASCELRRTGGFDV